MTNQLQWIDLDERAQGLFEAARTLATLWPIIREAQRGGRPATAEMAELLGLLSRIDETKSQLQAALAPPEMPRGYARSDLRTRS